MNTMDHPVVEEWLNKFGHSARYYLVTYPTTPHAAYHMNYDGVKCWLDMYELLKDRDPETAEALWRHAEETMAIFWGNETLRARPDERPGGVAGYYNYNIGLRMMADHPRSDDTLRNNYATLACNFARGSSFSTPAWTVGYRYLPPADGSWPNEGIEVADPTRPPANCRVYALALISHMVTDDIYAQYETRDNGERYGNVSFAQCHDWFIPEFLSRWFLGFDSHSGLDRPYSGCIDQWRDIDRLMIEADGDFTQVPESWEAPTTWEFTPFMFAHVARMLTMAYDHPAITGHEYASVFRAKILLAMSDICDISLRWFQKPSKRSGLPALMYRILEGGVEPEIGAADLAIFEAGMFAWSASKTGNATHHTFAIDLINAGCADGYWVWGKHYNQGTLGVLETFQNLFSEDEGMAVDIAALRALVDQLETEAQQAVEAKAVLDSAQVSVSEAQADLSTATAEYTRENDERLAKLQEIISLLQAGMTD